LKIELKATERKTGWKFNSKKRFHIFGLQQQQQNSKAHDFHSELRMRRRNSKKMLFYSFIFPVITFTQKKTFFSQAAILI
jgi:hypothetical protein